MKRISIGSWAYAIGPYENEPIEFDVVCNAVADKFIHEIN